MNGEWRTEIPDRLLFEDLFSVVMDSGTDNRFEHQSSFIWTMPGKQNNSGYLVGSFRAEGSRNDGKQAENKKAQPMLC